MNDYREEVEAVREFPLHPGLKAADVTRVAGWIGDARNGRMTGTELLLRIRAYYEADVGERLAAVVAVCNAADAEARHVVDDEVYVPVGLIRNALNGV